MSVKLYDSLGFLDPNRIRERYTPNLELARREGLKLRLRPASVREAAGNTRLLIGIDWESDFLEGGRLEVKGAFADLERFIGRMVRGVYEEVWTDMLFTIDVHPVFTIHSDLWWVDERGNNVDVGPAKAMMMKLDDPKAKYPFVSIFLDGRPSIRFKPVIEREWTVNKYAPHLLATGQGNIWVFASHCREGSDGISFPGALAEAIEWASAALKIQPTYMHKGMIPKVDWFGPFRPCMDVPGHPQGGLQTLYLDRIRASKSSDVGGEAADFCVKAGMVQILDYYGDDAGRSVLERVNFLGNCTSPIVADDPSKGNTPNADFVAKMVASGVNVIDAETPFD